ncbi:hypothetical protein BDN72DRAFT_904019 [Pluteus cervinus]|uniref:Uncharacterized protein n=1 Tax=Pluteus cervinus TaxID=181527 RepID=A0ACD3A6N1_9AGAR|nr:hypothetical protein BDN72DRAFT_904019 [Pluteus cervinus]
MAPTAFPDPCHSRQGERRADGGHGPTTRRVRGLPTKRVLQVIQNVSKRVSEGSGATSSSNKSQVGEGCREELPARLLGKRGRVEELTPHIPPPLPEEETVEDMLQVSPTSVVHQCTQVSIKDDLLGRYEAEHTKAEGCDPELSAAEKRRGFPTFWTMAETERWWRKPRLSHTGATNSTTTASTTTTATTKTTTEGTPITQPPLHDPPPVSQPLEPSPRPLRPSSTHSSGSKPPTDRATPETTNEAGNRPTPLKKPRALSLAALKKSLSIAEGGVDGTEGTLEFEHITPSSKSRTDPLSKYNRIKDQPIIAPPGAGKWKGPLPFFPNETAPSTATNSGKQPSQEPLPPKEPSTKESNTPSQHAAKPTSSHPASTASLDTTPSSPSSLNSASPLPTSPASPPDSTPPVPPAPSESTSEAEPQKPGAPYTLPFVKGSASPFAPTFSIQEFRARLRKLMNWPVLPSGSTSKQPGSDSSSQPKKKPRCEDLEEGELLPEPETSKGRELEEGECEGGESRDQKGSEKRRENGKKKYRGGQSHRERLALGLDKLSYQTFRTMRGTEYMESSGFSITDDGIATTTGWSGRELPRYPKEQMMEAHKNIRQGDELASILLTFTFAFYKKHNNLFFVDCDGRVFFYRSAIQYWMEELGHILCGQEKLIAGDVPTTIGEENHNRGRHAPVIVGHQRPYTEEVMLTMHHRTHAVTVNAYIRSDAFLRIVNWVCCIVMYAFPAVAACYLACAEYWAARGITPHFGLFWCYCWNACYKNQPRIHCQPHMDSKNVVGVCVVVVYEKPGYKFDHETRSWLVIWDAGIIVEMPPWTAAVYPSSLFLHFNIDLQDIKVLTLPGGDIPTVAQRAHFEERNMEGRGSIVFFNQANMFHYPELGFPSVSKAAAAGAPSKRDYEEDANVSFPKSNTPSNLLSELA